MDITKTTDETQRRSYALKKIHEILLRDFPEAGVFPTAIPGVFMARREEAGFSEHRFDKPLASLLVQGSKKTIIGPNEYSLQSGQLLTVGVDMPSSSQIVAASRESPLLTFYFYIDRRIINNLMLNLKMRSGHVRCAMGASVGDISADFAESLLKLLRIHEKPEQVPVRSDLVLADLHYLLLTGPQADILYDIYCVGGIGSNILAAIEYLKAHKGSQLNAADIAYAASMSESTLYRQFRALTGLSPLQYHKQLRIHEARRLIMTEGAQIAEAAYKVGYESVPQFIREYKKLFGQPPKRSKTLAFE